MSDFSETQADLLRAVSELWRQNSSWRLGQLIGNLTEVAGSSKPGSHWNITDDELLAAAKRLLGERDSSGLNIR